MAADVLAPSPITSFSGILWLQHHKGKDCVAPQCLNLLNYEYEYELQSALCVQDFLQE